VKRKAVFISMAAALVAVGGWRLHWVRAGRAEASAGVPTAEVRRGPLVITLPVSGLLESAVETPVQTEIAGVLVDICRDNAAVKPGDFIFQLDTKELSDQREERERALADAEEELNSAQADGETRIAQAESEADAAREALALAKDKARAEREKLAAQVKYAEGEVARAQRELQRSQRLAELKYIAGTKLREAERMYRGREFALSEQRAQQADVEERTAEEVRDQETALELARHGLETAKADVEADMEDARIHIAEAARRQAEVDKKIGQSTVAAPAGGLAVIQTNSANWPERRPYRLGDQVQSGASPVKIFDLSKMQVRCQIGEMDIGRVHGGQQAFVVASGRNAKRYRGRVALVEELAQEADVWRGGTPGKKVFEILVTLDEADPARLRPGMTVDLEIVLGTVGETVLAPIRAVFAEDGERVAYRARGKSFERVPVTVGERNDLVVEVRAGLGAGDRVALERPGAAQRAGGATPPAGRGEARR
jgi:multidrug resistance efflux pump